MPQRYFFIFYFDNRCGWNFICFNENGSYKKYFTCDEDGHDNSLDYIELFLENGGNLYKYNVPTYEDLCNAVDDIFSLKDSPIEELEKYRV